MDMTSTPTELDSLKANARLQEAAGNWTEALAFYQQMLAVDATNADLHNDIALAYEKSGDLALAEHHYRLALALDPHFYAAAYNLAQLIRADGNRDDSLKEFANAYGIASRQEERREVLLQLEALTGETVVVCAECRCVSPTASLFKWIQDKSLCPHCAMPAQHQEDQRNLWGGIFLLVVGLIFLTATSFFPGLALLHYLLAIIFTFVVVWGISVLGHELGHIAVLILTGGKIPALIFGAGVRLGSFAIGNTCVFVHALPISGITLFYYPAMPHIRWRAFFAIVAGPLVNLAFLLIAMPFAELPFQLFGDGLIRYIVAEAFFVVNLLFFVVNLIPLRSRSQSLGTPTTLASDGLQLLALLTNPQAVHAYSLMYYLTAYGNQETNPNYERVLQAAREGLQIHPQHPTLLLTAGFSCMELEQLEASKSYFHQVLLLNNEDVNTQTTAWNNLAYAYALEGDGVQAFTFARRAMWLVPWSPYVIGTYGAALIEQGKYEEGIEHLMEAFRRHTNDFSKASNLAYAAKGHVLNGRREEGLALLQQAESYPVQPLIVRRIREQLT